MKFQCRRLTVSFLSNTIIELRRGRPQEGSQLFWFSAIYILTRLECSDFHSRHLRLFSPFVHLRVCQFRSSTSFSARPVSLFIRDFFYSVLDVKIALSCTCTNWARRAFIASFCEILISCFVEYISQYTTRFQ